MRKLTLDRLPTAACNASHLMSVAFVCSHADIADEFLLLLLGQPSLFIFLRLSRTYICVDTGLTNAIYTHQTSPSRHGILRFVRLSRSIISYVYKNDHNRPQPRRIIMLLFHTVHSSQFFFFFFFRLFFVLCPSFVPLVTCLFLIHFNFSDVKTNRNKIPFHMIRLMCSGSSCHSPLCFSSLGSHVCTEFIRSHHVDLFRSQKYESRKAPFSFVSRSQTILRVRIANSIKMHFNSI